MKFTRKKIITIFCMLAACVFIWGIYIYNSMPPAVYWKMNERKMYSFYYRSFVNSPAGMVANGKGSLFGIIQVSGTLNFRVFDITDSGVRAGIQFSPVQVTYDGEKQDQLEEIFSGMFYVLFSPDGRLQSFEFSNKIAQSDRESIGEMIRSLEIVVPDTLLRSWKAEEKDKYGTYSSEYKLGNSLSKTKKKYTEISKSAGMGEGVSIGVRKSNTECKYGYPDTWLKDARLDELMVFYLNKKSVVMKISSTVKLETVFFDPDMSLAIWTDGRDPESDIAEWKSGPAEKLPVSVRQKIRSMEKHYGDMDFTAVVNKIFMKYTKFSRQCVSEILDYLKLFPEAASEIPDIILTDLHDVQRVMLINALQCDKSEYSQRALVRIIKGDEFPPDCRVQSAVAAGDIDKPVPGIVDDLMNMYEQRDNDSSLSIKISDSSILSLGRISGTLAGSGNADYEDTVTEINDKISSGFSEDGDQGRLSSVVYAAANTGDTGFVEPVSESLNSGSSMVRSAAALSLSSFMDGSVNSILTERLASESDVNVRSSIVKSLYNAKYSDEATKRICREVQMEDNEMVRNAMYRYLLKNRKKPGVRDVLSRMLISENSAGNRRLISRALASKK